MKGRDRMVYHTPRGWAEKRNDADRVGSYHEKQGDAIKQATTTLRNQGGGELAVQGENGRIRSKDTISPGNESKVHDTEH
jgi:hypothetical protein